MFAYAIVHDGVHVSAELSNEVKATVRKVIGPFAQPDHVVVIPALPTTRSGKTMRRLLRKIACGETESLGDVSTLADTTVVDKIIAAVAAHMKAATHSKRS